MSPRKRGRKKKAPKPIPNNISTELKMTVALKGFSDMKLGPPKQLADQYAFLSRFYHNGKPPNYPSQIKLLAKAKSFYPDLYKEIQVPSTNKKGKVKAVVRYKLKQTVSHDLHREYYTGASILFDELEKKNKMGKIFIGGRNIHGMATRGVRIYKKHWLIVHRNGILISWRQKNRGGAKTMSLNM